MRINKDLRELVSQLRQGSYDATERKEVARHILQEQNLGKRIWNSIKRNASFVVYLGIPLLAPLAVNEIGKNFYTEVKPLTYEDVNNDGKEDAIVAFPFSGIEKAVLGYIDGDYCPEQIKNENGNYAPFNVGLWRLNRFRSPIVEYYYTEGFNKNASIGVWAIVIDYENDGKKDIELF